MKKLLVAMTLVSFLFASFAQRILDFTVVSSKNVTINVKKDVPRVSAKAGTIKKAVDKAIESAGPGYDALMDGVITEYTWYAVLFAWNTYKVEGTPIKTTEITSSK